MFLITLGACLQAANAELPLLQRKRLTDRPYFVTFTQHKYNFAPTDSYYERWTDRPLYLDPSLRHEGVLCVPFGGLNFMRSYQSFADSEKTRELASHYGLDAFAYSAGPYHTRALPQYDYADRTKFPEVKILSQNLSLAPPSNISLASLYDKLLACKNHFKLGGKFVIFDRYTNPDYRQEILRSYGDRFVFIDGGFPHVHKYMGKFYAGEITADDIEEIKESFRLRLRNCDGFRVSLGEYQVRRDGLSRYAADFADNFILPLLASVFSEPDFLDRYLVVCGGPGHENIGLKGNGYLSHDGTKTLRRTMESALKANADIVDLFEWDEVNENTHVQPTVYNGKSVMRIVRYYTTRERGEKLSALPGDKTSQLPNLCLSLRKSLVYGEKLELELLNIPEDERNFFYSVKLSLHDDSGKKVKQFEEITFDASRLYDETLVCPSEDFAPARFLRPVLEISYRGRQSVISDGLHHIELRSVYNFDHSYVKQPLRDLLTIKRASFNEVASPDHALRRFRVELENSKPLKYIEAIDNSLCIYAHGDYSSTAAIECGTDDYYNLPDPRNFIWRENENYRVLEFLPMSLDVVKINGTLRLKGGEWKVKHSTGKWSLGQRSNVTADKDTLTLKNYVVNTQFRRFFLAIPREYDDTAVMEFEFENFPKSSIPLRELVEKQSVLINGMYGVVASFHRYLRQNDHPMPLGKKKCAFEFDMIPNRKAGVVYVQAITADGHLWRSQPIVLDRSGRQAEVAVYSDTQKRGIRIKVDSIGVPSLDYSAANLFGALMRPPNSNRSYWGVAGGLPTMATLQLGGESDTSGPFRHTLNQFYSKDPKDVPNTAPEIRDGAYVFSKPGMYLALHQGVVPRRAGFTLSFKVKFDEMGREQHIFRHQGNQAGGLAALFVNQKGELLARYGGGPEKTASINSGFTLEAGKWADIQVDLDMNHIRFTVDDVTGKNWPMPGCGARDVTASFGGYLDRWVKAPQNNRWFIGEIKDIKLRFDVPNLSAE